MKKLFRKLGIYFLKKSGAFLIVSVSYYDRGRSSDSYSRHDPASWNEGFKHYHEIINEESVYTASISIEIQGTDY